MSNSNDQFIDPADAYQMQMLPALNANLNLDPEADANAERRPIIPPSELIMGSGIPYKASVAFVSADPKKRWKMHTHKSSDGTPFPNPFSGAMVQYTLIDTPGGQFDGFTISDYIMTMTQRNGTCTAMGLLQAMKAWHPSLQNGGQLVQAIEQAMLRTPVIGVHIDWRGQRVFEVQQFQPDGKTPLISPNGTPITERRYEDVPGLESWRGFYNMQPPETGKIPPSRIECKDKDGHPVLDANRIPIVYTAKAEVIRKEALGASGTQQTGNPFGAAPNGVNPFGAPAPMGAPPPPIGYPPPQVMTPTYQTMPPQQYAPPPAAYQQPSQQQFQQPQQQPQYPQQAPPPMMPLPPAPAPPAPPQQAPQYQAPQPTQPWQQQPPAWVNK